MKQCKCGRTIPSTWPMCGECVVASQLPYEAPPVRADRMLQRRFKILSRMQQYKLLLAQLEVMDQADQGTQGTQGPLTRDEQDAMILRARIAAKRREHGRVRQSFDEWLDKD